MYQKTEENTDQARIRDIENVSSSDSKGGGVGSLGQVMNSLQKGCI